MRVLIVHAHPEPESFNGALTRSARAELIGAGHECLVSDLYAMGFDPVSDRRNFTNIANGERYSQQDEERLASDIGGFAPELQLEIDKLLWCDLLIFQFPIWWLGLPAILKGWVDRVFAVGQAYGGGRWFDHGRMKGKRAMLSLTVGGPEPVYSEIGAYGAVRQILHPIHRGIFGFCGFTVLEPHVVFGPGRMSPAERVAALAAWREMLADIDGIAELKMPDSKTYDGFLLRPGAEPAPV